MSMWLYLCDVAWKLYDNAVKTGKWREYLKHRKTCTICRLEKQ